MKNAGITGAGKGVQGILSLIALALAARQLGPEAFGFFVLIHSMVFGISHILRFQTWQAVLKYGAEALENAEPERLRILLRFCFTLDILAAIGGCAVMVIIAGPLSSLFGLPQDQVWMAQLYALSIIFMVLTPTQTGVLRLFDRFDLLAIQTVIAPSLRLVGTLFLFFTSGSLLYYLIVWFLGGIISRQAMLIFSGRELLRRGYGRGCFLPVHPLRPPESKIWRFILSHNVSGGLNVSRDEIGLLMVGWMLGPAAAGMFKIAQKFADILIKPANKMLIPAMYPELARFEAEGQAGQTKAQFKSRRAMLRKNLMVVGGLALIIFASLVLGGKWLITAFYGPDYSGSYATMIWLCLAGVVSIVTYPLEPLLSAAGKVRHMMAAYGTGLAVYIVGIYWLTGIFSLSGAGMASSLGALASAILLYYGGGARILKANAKV